MNSIWINAPAKINIGLDVLRRREDGYHEVKMIMQSIRLFDRLTLTKSDKPGIRLTTNLRFLPVNEDNLVYRSAKLLMDELYELGLSKRQLMKRGVRLGADIPYCILKGTALSEGIGEKISTIPKMPDCYVLICKPGIHVSTGFVYTNLVLDEN